MKTAYTYTCKDYPGMEKCQGRFTAETVVEVMKHVELHASDAHGEDPEGWSEEDRTLLKSLIKSE